MFEYFYFPFKFDYPLVTGISVCIHARAKLRKGRRNRSNRGRDMAIFRFFKTVEAAISEFQNFKFLTVGWLKRVELCHRAKFGHNRSNHCQGMAIFRFLCMAAAAILAFYFLNFNGRDADKGQTVSPCQMWSKSVKPLPRYAEFSIFPRWRSSAIFDLLCPCLDHP